MVVRDCEFVMYKGLFPEGRAEKGAAPTWDEPTVRPDKVRKKIEELLKMFFLRKNL